MNLTRKKSHLLPSSTLLVSAVEMEEACGCVDNVSTDISLWAILSCDGAHLCITKRQSQLHPASVDMLVDLPAWLGSQSGEGEPVVEAVLFEVSKCENEKVGQLLGGIV